MDTEPGPDFRVIAAIELTAGMANMKIAQTEGAGYRVLESLRKRPPEALLGQPDADARDGLCALLIGFERAARDYGAQALVLIANGLDAWRDVLEGLAEKLGMSLFMPDAQQCADMVMRAACARMGVELAGRAFIMPMSADTRFMTGDGLISRALPMGLDEGRYGYLMRDAELERARRKGGVAAHALLRDGARACAHSLPVLEPGAYSPVICMDSDMYELNEGEYSAKQLGRLINGLARKLRAQGALPGYVRSASEHCSSTRIRRALNGLIVADEIRARAGFGGVRLVKASALDAALGELARAGQMESAGVDAKLAERGVQYYAHTWGIESTRIESARTLAGMLTKAMSGAFSESEQSKAAEVAWIASALMDCFAIEGAVRLRDMELLPGLGTERRRELLGICEACMERDNDGIYSRLAPGANDAQERDEEALFSAEAADPDEFANADEDDDDLESIAGSDAEAALEELMPAGELSDDAQGDAALDADDDLEGAEPLESPDSDEQEGSDREALDASASRPYYALKLKGMVSTGMREYAEMFGGDGSADEAQAVEPVQLSPVRTERYAVGTVLAQARKLPLQLRIAAVLMLVRALVASGTTRLSRVSAKLGERGLVVRASARDGAALELLEFRYRAELFKRVFGIKARLKLDKHGKPSKQRR